MYILYHLLSICLLKDTFHIFTIVNAAVNTEVHISFQIHAAFVELLLRREIPGFNDNSSSTYLPHTYKVPRTSLVAQTVKCLAYNIGDLGSIPGSGRSSGEGNGNPVQYSCLENPMDRGPHSWATVHGGRKESDKTERLHFTSLQYKVPPSEQAGSSSSTRLCHLS